MAHAFIPSEQKADAGESLGVQGQHGLQELVPEKLGRTVMQGNPVSKNKTKQNKKIKIELKKDR